MTWATSATLEQVQMALSVSGSSVRAQLLHAQCVCVCVCADLMVPEERRYNFTLDFEINPNYMNNSFVDHSLVCEHE